MKCIICNSDIEDLAAWSHIILNQLSICYNCHEALRCGEDCHCSYRRKVKIKN